METLLGYLPFVLLLLLCPLLMTFMHGSHGHDDAHRGHDAQIPQPGSRIGTGTGTDTPHHPVEP